MFYRIGQGPLIVFLHGWGSQKEVFNHFYQDLKNDFTLLGIDLPGFGQNPLNEVYHVEDYLKYLENYLKEENVYAFVGHSFGARLACDLVHRVPCEKLILIASSGFRIIKLKTKIKIFIYKNLSKVLRIIAPSLLEKMKRKLGSYDYIHANEVMRKTLVHVLHEGLKEEEVRKISIPALLVWGTKDDSTPFILAKKFNELISNSGIVEVKNGSHYPFFDDYFTVLKAIEYFLKKC